MSKHLAQTYLDIADRFEQDAKFFIETNNSWAFVAIFYAALHRINSVLAPCGFDPEHKRASHNVRGKIINECNTGLEKIAKEYRTLKTISSQVRYHGKTFPSHFFETIFAEYYEEIKKCTQEILDIHDFPNNKVIKSVASYVSRYMS